jgi:hypothetical protein
MRSFLLGTVVAASVFASLTVVACGSSSNDDGSSGGTSGGTSGTSGGTSGTSGSSGGTSGASGGTSGTSGGTSGTSGGTSGTSGGTSGSSGTSGGLDGGTDSAADAAEDAFDSAVPEVPALQYVGRVDMNDAAGARLAWPGTRVVARFDGTDVSVKLTQFDGFSTNYFGPSWMNVIIDGVVQAPFQVDGGNTVPKDYVIATGLAAGIHVIEIEKRTEANAGTVRFEGFTYTGGAATLLAPPARPTRRIEFLSDSTIDGFGVDGTLGDVNTCSGPVGTYGAYCNERKSMAFLTSASLSAEMNLIAYSGKGFTTNESAGDNVYFPEIYPRTLPEVTGSVWDFTKLIPDAVVISLGGEDVDGVATVPAGFQAAYTTLVTTIRTNYPSAYIWLTVWAQIKNGAIASRTAMTNSLNAIVAAKADAKMYVYSFPESNGATDETGCAFHANAALHTSMAALMVTEIKGKTGW